MKILVVIFFLLLAAPAQAVTRYVQSSCTNGITTYNPAGAGTCTGGSATVYSTIQAGINATASGDILDIRGGAYSEHLNQTGWSSGSYPGTTVRGHAGETVTIFPPDDYGSLCSGPGICGALDTSGQQYVTYQNLKFDGTWADGTGVVYVGRNTSSNHIRFDGVEIYNCGVGKPNSRPGACFYTSDTADAIEFINGSLHDSGTTTNNIAFGGPAPYCSYWSAGNSRIENNDIYNCGGFGLHIYNTHSTALDNIVITRNRFWNTGIRYWQENGSGPRDSCAILHSNGHNIQITNNLVRGGSTWDRTTGICSAGSAVNPLIANNTVTGFNYAGGEAGASIGIDTNNSTGTVAENNISSGNAINFSGSATYAKNLCSADGTGCDSALTESSATTFVNPASDWSLKAGSKAIGAGLDLSKLFTVDINNATRTGWDIGAYKYTVIPACPAVSPSLVASYSFEGNGADSTGNGRTATLGSGWTYTTGHTGQGALSNGTSGITVADHNSLDPCAAFTYEGWISLANTSGNYAFINKNPDSKAYLFASVYAYCGSGVPMGGYVEDVNSTRACWPTALTPGFKHLAVTYDSTLASANTKLYLNGVEVASADGTALLTATTGTLQFCTSNFGETCPSGTVIDEIRIYNYARSASEILSSITAPPVYTIKLQVSSLKIGPSVSLKVGVP